MVCSLMSAGCQSVGTHSLTPSPDGSVIASIDRVEVQILGPETIRIYRGAYLRITKNTTVQGAGFHEDAGR